MEPLEVEEIGEEGGSETGFDPFSRAHSDQQYHSYMIQGTLDSNIRKITNKRIRNMEAIDESESSLRCKVVAASNLQKSGNCHEEIDDFLLGSFVKDPQGSLQDHSSTLHPP